MNLKQLNHLLVVAQTGSFSRAADRLHLTQPALSRSIQLLEEDLGAKLIDRMGRHSQLTPLGQSIATRARLLVSDAEALRREVDLLRTGELTPIRIGLGSGPAALLMTSFLVHMARLHPEVSVTIARGSIDSQLHDLRERALDALVMDLQRVAPAKDLKIEVMAELRVAFVCRAGHPLLQHGGTPVAVDQLLRFPLATPPAGDAIRRLLTRQFGSSATSAAPVRLTCEDVDSLLQAVTQSDAVFLGTAVAARNRIDLGELVEVATDPPLLHRAQFALVTLSGMTEGPSMAMFRDFVRERLHDGTLKASAS